MLPAGASPSHPVPRRRFLQGSALSLGGLLLPEQLLTHTAKSTQATAVVWLWLGGGPSHIETFDPKMSAPSAYRSTVGAVQTVVPGIELGGLFPKMAAVADRMAFVRSFGHHHTCHDSASHLVMTGYDAPSSTDHPASPGALLAHQRGPWTVTGLPTYIRLGGITGDGPGRLGPTCQALDAPEIVDLQRESPRLRARYGPGLGQQLLTARLLCEAGVGFVTIHFPGWDMHGQLVDGFRQLAPQLDHAVAAFIEDTVARGLDRQILLVITGEFGRTPRLNAHCGRDHWPTLTPLAFAGGGLKMGQIIGASTERGEMPRTTAIGPRQLQATVLHVLGMPLPPGNHPITELI